MIGILESAIRRLSHVTYVIGAVAIGLMMLHVSVHVFFQYVLSDPLPGTMLFVSNYYMVAVTFICLAAVELKGGHISVDILFVLLPKKARRFLGCVAYLISTVMFVLLTWQSFLVAEARRAAGTFEIEYGITILIWPSYYLMPIGTGLFACTVLIKLLKLALDEPEDMHSHPIENV